MCEWFSLGFEPRFLQVWFELISLTTHGWPINQINFLIPFSDLQNWQLSTHLIFCLCSVTQFVLPQNILLIKTCCTASNTTQFKDLESDCCKTVLRIVFPTPIITSINFEKPFSTIENLYNLGHSSSTLTHFFNF